MPKSVGKQRCEYCRQSAGDRPVIKTILRQKHTFCSELCWALYRYKFPKDKIWVNWS